MQSYTDCVDFFPTNQLAPLFTYTSCGHFWLWLNVTLFILSLQVFCLGPWRAFKWLPCSPSRINFFSKGSSFLQSENGIRNQDISVLTAVETSAPLGLLSRRKSQRDCTYAVSAPRKSTPTQTLRMWLNQPDHIGLCIQWECPRRDGIGHTETQEWELMLPLSPTELKAENVCAERLEGSRRDLKGVCNILTKEVVLVSPLRGQFYSL